MSEELTRIQGYVAAGSIIEALLNEAEKKLEPDRKVTRNHNYRQGYYEGILAAHCQLALGEFPNHPTNAEAIRKTLKHHRP